MSKTIDSLVQASLDGKNFTGVILARLHFGATTYRYANTYQSIYWDETGGGDQEYIGLGNLAGITPLTETNELGAQTIQLTVSGVPNNSITEAFSDNYINQPVYIWYATLDPTTYSVEGGQNGPILIFAGRMDFAAIEFGETATITINATSRLADWERSRGGRFNDGYQRKNIDPTDRAFRYVRALQSKTITWGRVSNVDPGDNDGQPDPRNGGTPADWAACFTWDTRITMADGNLRFIRDIVEGDEVLDITGKPAKVVGTHHHIYRGDLIGLNHRVPFATSMHPFLTKEGWVSDKPEQTKQLVDDIEVSQLEVGQLLQTQKGNTKLDYIPREEVDNISVFNISVESGTYIAEGLFVHNK